MIQNILAGPEVSPEFTRKFSFSVGGSASILLWQLDNYGFLQCANLFSKFCLYLRYHSWLVHVKNLAFELVP